ncbi:unnamed protein product [Ambrosiozyma monospora]|uniref:Unnamed protein product n=1 Tax=Ambrosiozyma monospora TaxID=43982 RepID=A0A9W6Z3V0_AMBMO|nr:unnamed protein product [Ambrosiozyma monospora]
MSISIGATHSMNDEIEQQTQEMSELIELNELAKAIVLACIAEADASEFNSVNHFYLFSSSLTGPIIRAPFHNNFPKNLRTKRERLTQIEGIRSDIKTIIGRFNDLLSQIRMCLASEIELKEKDNADQNSIKAILRSKREFNRYNMYIILSLPILQYLPVPEVEILTGQPTKQTNPTEEAKEKNDKKNEKTADKRTRTKTFKGTNSKGSINAILQICKPLWFIPAGLPQSEPELSNNLESRYNEFLKSVDHNAIHKSIRSRPVNYLSVRNQTLTQSNKESICGENLSWCLLDELEICTGYILEKEFDLQSRLAEVLPERMAINGLATNIRVDFAMTKNM